jgi:predicted amidohydrolase
MTRIRLGVAAVETDFGDEEHRNLPRALDAIRRAGALDVDLLMFAENFPGPFTERHRYEVHGPISDAAREHGVAVVYGTSVECAEPAGSYNIAAVVVDAEGTTKGSYLRTHPLGPYIYRSGPQWNFDYVEAEDFPVFDMGWGKLAISICSEVHLPEIARIYAIKGAEVCLIPSGLLIDELGYTDNWRTLVRARAIENLMYTATTVNLMSRDVAMHFAPSPVQLPEHGSGLTAGIAMIASPERVLAESHEPGILTAELDLDRLRWLRATQEELIVPAPYRTIPGHLSWRRPEIYGDLLKPDVDADVARDAWR